MNGLIFEEQPPVVLSDPNRADIACLVGFVDRRDREVPSEVRRWLDERGWTAPRYGSERIEKLLDLPVPVDSWDVFDRLFAWERRDLDGRGQLGTSYLGAAVRSFFAQGGRKCYVVRVGDPWPLASTNGARAERIVERLEKLIPGYPQRVSASPVDQESWQGIGHLFGLPDVSFLCLPDLADAVGIEHERIEPPKPLPSPDEQFVECSDPQPAPSVDLQARLWRAPRCDETGYAAWAQALRLIADLIARQQREVQLVAAIPIPEEGKEAERDLLEFLVDGGHGPLATLLTDQPDGLASAFVQLTYPWTRTPGSRNLPEQLESPDAVLAGILARNALARGAFRSAAGLHLGDVYDVYPSLRRDQMLKPHLDDPAESTASHTLLERVSLFGPTPSGLKLLSDNTTSLSESYRPASVNRLISAIVRASRRLGEELVFETSNERLWTRLRDHLNGLLLGLLHMGALRGQTPAEAFRVRCDRSTMSQNDVDSGRVVAEVQFDPAAAIERITVVLAMDEGGQVSLASTEMG